MQLRRTPHLTSNVGKMKHFVWTVILVSSAASRVFSQAPDNKSGNLDSAWLADQIDESDRVVITYYSEDARASSLYLIDCG